MGQTKMNMLQNRNSVSLSDPDNTERWNMNVKSRSITILLFALVLLAGIAVYFAPSLLACADKPVKSAAIILFLGPNPAAREKEADRLLNEGYAKLLIVPGLQRIIAPAGASPQLDDAIKKIASSGVGGYPGYYEKTHLEVLYAQKTMKAMGIKSAIMVSSPYHMKRIKMICEKTFGWQASYISYVPTRYELSMTDLGHIDRADIRPMMLEFVKIFWFYLYSSFSGQV